MSKISGKAVVIDAQPTATGDARRGGGVFPVLLNGRLCDENCDKRVAFLLCHPAGNFTTHYLLPHLEERGIAAMGMATRYINNELELTMEVCVQDLGRGVQFLRDSGYEKVILIGNSGGGALSCLYQAEAEAPFITTFPDGDPLDIGRLVPVDGLVLLSPHPGRAQALTEWLDPAVIDEGEPHLRDPDLDLFADRPLPFDRQWIAEFRRAQLQRNRRLSDYALTTLKALRAQQDGPLDQVMTVHGTGADPRFVDLTLDPNGRKPRPIETVRRLNNSHLSMGRLSTLRTWLSQWSVDHSRADGPDCFARTRIPALLIEHGNDEIVFPSYLRRYKHARQDVEVETLEGATHFMIGQDAIKDRLAGRLVRWARELC
ncbi:alpha/beta fold hydrolase [Aurantiacibacter poecillastricola]|uniref:alpha/beta fold hydrolase n=1 Tax=Aurantiacibacter poecillastricola TaxID=3064385 RepID=UPI00273ED5F7|nr:alpha/beta fold hydrolase [Aurantiacibacter sp. 219JJ12-13]MDP5261250.1 alpha/beta fold hydrolase [Aurantiacibacter sp. 219JJ12-13]